MLPSKFATAPPAAVLLAVATATVFLCCSIGTTNAQENIQPNIPPSLAECYNTSFFMNRDNRLPTTIESLITLIEKVENSDGYNMDIRTLAVALLHRFRQDGIQRAPGVLEAPGIIPYSPIGFQFPKFRILLQRLIPGNALQFPNSSLSREERCSMHFMLSSSFNKQVRGDENQVCNQLSQYRAQRLQRAVGAQSEQNNFIGDIEILESIASSKAKKRGIPAQQFGNQIRPNVDFDYIDYGNDNSASGQGQVSQCPVENGVIWTPWGAVTAGTVIAGIAAGLQPQQVQLRTLLSLARRPGVNSPQMATLSVDNRWAATLSGDLAEVALVQVPSTPTQQATVGANGAWNNTVTPHWYFLTQRQNLEMTDAEIRGGLDGLILAMNVANWRTQASNLKLSQLLRMYYSMDGVLGSGIMACNRKDQFPNVAPLADINAQTNAFAQVLNREMQLRVTLEPTPIAQFSSSAANALTSYIPQYMNDVSCTVSSQPQDVSSSITAMTNIYIFLDTSWQYKDVSNYVNYIIQRLNVNPFASSVTLLGAQDGSIIVNTTNYVGDVFIQWNVTSHSWYTPGFNLPTVLQTITNITQNLLNGEQTNSTVGGRSLVALLIPNMAQLSDTDSSYSVTRIQYINEQIPDLKFIFYTGGTTTRFSAFVQDPTTDIFPLSIGSNYATASGPVVTRIKKIPRRIINPRCGSAWYTSSYGTDQMYQYARPGVINYYRMAPNYFFGKGTGRYVNIVSQGAVQFTVCSSRTTVLPSQNATNNNNGNNGAATDAACTQLTGNTYTYDLSNVCSGYNTITQCPPLYISVQAPQVSAGGGSLTTSCIDAACQTPDQARYTVSVVNLGCYSGVSGLLASFALIILASLLRQFLQ